MQVLELLHFLCLLETWREVSEVGRMVYLLPCPDSNRRVWWCVLGMKLPPMHHIPMWETMAWRRGRRTKFPIMGSHDDGTKNGYGGGVLFGQLSNPLSVYLSPPKREPLEEKRTSNCKGFTVWTLFVSRSRFLVAPPLPPLHPLRWRCHEKQPGEFRGETVSNPPPLCEFESKGDNWGWQGGTKEFFSPRTFFTCDFGGRCFFGRCAPPPLDEWVPPTETVNG